MLEGKDVGVQAVVHAQHGHFARRAVMARSTPDPGSVEASAMAATIKEAEITTATPGGQSITAFAVLSLSVWFGLLTGYAELARHSARSYLRIDVF
jgi:hypothetical protein